MLVAIELLHLLLEDIGSTLVPGLGITMGNW